MKGNSTLLVHSKSVFVWGLVLSPLVYCRDGDNFRAFEVVIIGFIFAFMLLFSSSRLVVKRSWDNAFFFSVFLYLLLQPVAGRADFLFNFKFAVTMLMCFLPYYVSQSMTGDWGKSLLSAKSAITFVFYIAFLSIVISYIFVVGEVHQNGGIFQRRAFAWLGDSFSPVMVFFVFYFYFSKHYMKACGAVVCLILMQAKMAFLMLIFGLSIYTLLRYTRLGMASLLFPIFVAGAGYLAWNSLSGFLNSSIHNFEYAVNNRFLSIIAGIMFFYEEPLWGVGANQTLAILSSGFDMKTIEPDVDSMNYYGFFQIHNAFIRTAAELGVFGLLPFIFLCITMVRTGMKSILEQKYVRPWQGKALVIATSLWVVSFILFYQTTGWFEPGHPQLSWLICFWTLLQCARHNMLKNEAHQCAV